ncbi:uncharacterized protein rab44 [Anoplopoma fimbria]|uniref:uncharacterized protein rab44 n=1 Tax=Anoplopoma fimbria TaxID=229290 RepID=UPI0023ED2169|nr:uncharacterized protein rab44 [Anoplopoma fimbria]
MEPLLEQTDKFDTAQPVDVSDQVKENEEVGTLVGISNLDSLGLQSSSTVDQQTTDQSNIREMPDEELPNVCSVTEEEKKETDEDTEWFRQDEKLQDKYLMSQDIESSITPEITTEEPSSSSRVHTQPECSVEQEIFPSPKEELHTNEGENDIFNLPKVKGDHHSEDAVNKLHEQDVKPTENQEMPQVDYLSESVIHDATDISEIISGNLMNQTEVSDTYQSELTMENTDDSPTNQDNSKPDDKQDEDPIEEINFEASEQKNEDDPDYERKEPQISDIARADTALGQVFEIEGRVEGDTNPNAEQAGHQEKEEVLSDMEERASSLQTMHSEINVPYDSQPQQSHISFNPIGSRRKLGSSRRNKGTRHVKDSVAESDHEPTEDVVGNTSDNETLETTEMTLTIETTVKEKSMEPLLEQTDKFDTAQTEDVSDQVKENEEVGTLVGISNLDSLGLQSSSTVDQQTNDQSNIREMPDEELPNVCSVTEEENKETDEDTEWFRQDEKLQDKYLMSQDIESSITPEITTEEPSSSSRVHTQPECSVEQEIFSSPKEELHTNEGENDIFNLPKVKGDHHSEDAVNKLHEQDVKPTENQEMPQVDYLSESVIHDATDISEIISGNLMNQMEVSDTYQSELTMENTDDSPTNQDNSKPDDKQDEDPIEEINFEASEQKNEDDPDYERKEPQISDIARADTALGQVFEIEGRVEGDTNPNAEQAGHQEKEEVLSDMEERASSLQTMHSEINVPYDSQPQQSDISFNPIGSRRKLGSSRRNKGRKHVKDSVAESDHEPTEDVVGNTSDNETLETTEMTLTIETTVKEKSMEPLLEQTDKFDTAQTEDVSDQVKENEEVGTLVGISNLDSLGLQSSSTVDQQTTDQSNIREMPDEELPNVCSVTEEEKKETDEDTEWFRQDEKLQDKYLMSQDIESSITPEITTEEPSSSSRVHTQPECSVEQEIFSSPKEELHTNEGENDIFNLPKVKGDHHSEDAVNKLHEQDVKPTENQEMPQVDYLSESVIHDATDISEIISGNLMNQTDVSDTYQSEVTVKYTDDSSTNQDNSQPDDKQHEHPTKENNFEASEQKNEDDPDYERKEPQISDIARADTALGQVFEIEGRVEGDTKPNAEQAGHQEKEEVLSDMEERASSLQTMHSEINVLFDSQPQQSDISFNPIGSRRKLGSSRRNKGRRHAKDSVAEPDHGHDEEDLESTRCNEALEPVQMLLPIEKTSHEELSQGSQYDFMPATHDSSLYSAIMPAYSSEGRSPTLKNYPEAVLESLIPQSENPQEDHDEIEKDIEVEMSDKSVEATLEGADITEPLQSQEVRGDHHTNDIKPSAEQAGYQEKEGLFSEMEESASSSQTLQSVINVPFDSEAQQNNNGFNPIRSRRKLGSSRRNKGRQHVKDSVAESDHEPTEDVVGNTSDNETLKTTEMTSTIETTVQEDSMETLLERTDKIDTAQTEDVSDQEKVNAQVGTLVGIDLMYSSSTVDQQTINQSNFRDVSDKELPNVCSVTEKENEERDEDKELFRQDGNMQSNYSLIESHIKSSFTLEISKEKSSPEQHNTIECSIEQAGFSSSEVKLSTNEEEKEHVNLSQVRGTWHSQDAVNEVHEEEIKSTQMQEMHQMDNLSIKDSESNLPQLQSEINATLDSQPLDSSQNIKEHTHKGFSSTGNRRKLGSSRRNGRLHVKDATKMSLGMETMRQEDIKERTDLDSKFAGEMRKSGSTVNDEENTEKMSEDDTILSQNVIGNNTSVAMDITSSSGQDDSVEFNKKVTDEEPDLTKETENLSQLTGCDKVKMDLMKYPEVSVWKDDSDIQSIACLDDNVTAKSIPSDEAFQGQNQEASYFDKEIIMHQENDAAETVGDVTIKYCKPEGESSVYVEGYGQHEDGEQFEGPVKKEHEGQEMNVSKEITHDQTDTLVTFDIGLKDENLRAEPAVDVSEESGISIQQGIQEKPNLDDSENLQGRSKQKRRKMGSTRRTQLNRKPEETRVETTESDTEADVRNLDKMEVVKELKMIATAALSQNENAKPSLSLDYKEQQETNETSTVDGKGQKLQSSDLQSNMMADIDYSKALPPEKSASNSEEDPVKFVHVAVVSDSKRNVDVSVEPLQRDDLTVTEMQNLEMKNASPHLDSTSRRRKMGSTRRNLRTGTKRDDLHLKQGVNEEATEAATNVGHVKTESLSSTIKDELQLHVEHKDSGSELRVHETMEHSHTGESLAHQTSEENPVSQGQLLETEHQLTPSSVPAIPSTSPKHDSISESASRGRRRKMGSHRKSHGHQNYENQTARGDRETGSPNERDVRSIREESALETEELREEGLGLDKISKVDKSQKKPLSNLSTAKEGEPSRPVSDKTSEPVTTVQHQYAGIRNQESEQMFSLAGRADLRSNAYNVMMVGDSSVGKTSFMKRAQSGKFSLDLPASVGLDSCMWNVVVEGKPVVLQLWDTAGQERFHSITRQIFHKAHAFLLMYDITCSQSFSQVSYWASCIQEGAAENVTTLLVGNKSDRAERQVKTQEAEILAKEYNFEFMECSAATGENVVQSLETVARMLSQKADTRDDAIVLHKEPQPKTSSRCC